MRLNSIKLHLGAALFASLLIFISCTKDEGVNPDRSLIDQRSLSKTDGTPVSTALIGLTPTNELVSLFSGPPAMDMGVIPITGLRDGESILAIDTRPRIRQLFGVSNFNFLYIIDPNTGVAVSVSPEPFTPAIEGHLVGFDFNPLDDMIRLVTESGQNLRISPNTGAVVGVDFMIDVNMLALNAIAYSNATVYSRSALYGIDVNTGNFYLIHNPNAGSAFLLGSTGYEMMGDGGFEITAENYAFAAQFGKARNPGGPVTFGTQAYDNPDDEMSRLFAINLRTGVATSYGKTRQLIGLASR